jgi:D-glycero-alpha-D-manno-heptose 1-phosphate guanylyltransferase
VVKDIMPAGAELGQVVILAGGLGTRLRPSLGAAVPKSLAPVAGRPFLSHLMDRFARSGASDFLLLTGEGGAAVRAALEAYPPGRVTYSQEPEPMGTGGALLLAASRGLLAERFLFANGDSLLEDDPRDLLAAHLAARSAHGALATFAAVEVEDAGRYGALSVAGWDGEPERSGRTLRLARFSEKSGREPGLVSAGLVAIERELIERWLGPAPVSPSSWEHDLVPAAIAAGTPLAVWTSDAIFSDIGTPESYRAFRRRMGERAT